MYLVIFKIYTFVFYVLFSLDGRRLGGRKSGEFSEVDWLFVLVLLEFFFVVVDGNRRMRMRGFCRWTVVRGVDFIF